MLKSKHVGITIAAALLVLLLSSTTRAQHRVAFSENNGIEILSDSSEWCSINADLEFRLRADSRLRDEQALSQFVSNLGPALERQCPQLRTANIRIANEAGLSFAGAETYQIRADLSWSFASVVDIDFDHDPGAAHSTGQSPPAHNPALAEAREIDNDDIVRTIFRHLPEYAALDRHPGTLNSLAAIYHCELMLEANQSNEFARREVERRVRPELDRLTSSSPEIDGALFRVSLLVELGEYDFESAGFRISPFERRFDLETDLRAANGCRISQDRGLPWDVFVHIPDAGYVNRLPIPEQEGRTLLANIQSKNRGRRTVEAEVVYRVIGADASNSQLVIEIEPIQIRFLSIADGSELYLMDENHLARLRQAEAERLRLAEVARIEAEREQARVRFLQHREDEEAELRGRLQLLERREERIFEALGSGSPIFGHPSLLAALAQARQHPVEAAVIFEAGNREGDAWRSTWPQELTVRLNPGADTELRSGQWAVVHGELSPGQRGNRMGLMPAEIDAHWVFVCTDRACEADAETEALMERATEELDRALEENLAGLGEDEGNTGSMQ